MKWKAAVSVLAVLGLVAWGCAKPSSVAPVAEDAAPTATPEAQAAAETPSPAAVAVPQLGLGDTSEGSAGTLPPRVQRFVEAMYTSGRGQLNSAWIDARLAREHLEEVVPAIVHGLTRKETMVQARQLLADIGPRAAPYVRSQLDRLKRDAAADQTLQRATRPLEQLLSSWR